MFNRPAHNKICDIILHRKHCVHKKPFVFTKVFYSIEHICITIVDDMPNDEDNGIKEKEEEDDDDDDNGTRVGTFQFIQSINLY